MSITALAGGRPTPVEGGGERMPSISWPTSAVLSACFCPLSRQRAPPGSFAVLFDVCNERSVPTSRARSSSSTATYVACELCSSRPVAVASPRLLLFAGAIGVVGSATGSSARAPGRACGWVSTREQTKLCSVFGDCCAGRHAARKARRAIVFAAGGCRACRCSAAARDTPVSTC